MKNELNIFCSVNFDGFIYIDFNTSEQIDNVRYKLCSNDVVVAEKESVDVSETIFFAGVDEGDYTVIATVTAQDQNIIDVSSPTIHAKNRRLFSQTKSVQTIERKLKGKNHIIDGVVDYFLEIKFKAGGDKKFKHENVDGVSHFSSFTRMLIKNTDLNINDISLLKVFTSAISNKHGYNSLGNLYKINATASFDLLDKISEQIEKLDYVEYCAVVPVTDNLTPVTQPLFNDSSRSHRVRSLTPPTATPDFSAKQTYLDAGYGMNVRAAWALENTGSNVNIRHLDFGVYHNHEDLKGNITVVASRSESEDCNHGTASTGIIAAVKNTLGVTGIAHGAKFYFYDTDYLDLIVKDALPGDIVSLNVQFSINGTYVPVTTNKSWWDKINALVNRGVVVILAAGNGGDDLRNLAEFDDYGDNGSMLVGACEHDTGRSCYFSNYSHSTSLVNSWGDWSVTSTGYGSLQMAENERSYCDDFSGTSSATPLVSGALALIQSYAKNNYGVYFNAHQMRDVIVKTGGNEGVVDGIGYRPNIVAAMKYIDTLLQTSE